MGTPLPFLILAAFLAAPAQAANIQATPALLTVLNINPADPIAVRRFDALIRRTGLNAEQLQGQSVQIQAELVRMAARGYADQTLSHAAAFTARLERDGLSLKAETEYHQLQAALNDALLLPQLVTPRQAEDLSRSRLASADLLLEKKLAVMAKPLVEWKVEEDVPQTEGATFPVFNQPGYVGYDPSTLTKPAPKLKKPEGFKKLIDSVITHAKAKTAPAPWKQNELPTFEELSAAAVHADARVRLEAAEELRFLLGRTDLPETQLEKVSLLLAGDKDVRVQAALAATLAAEARYSGRTLAPIAGFSALAGSPDAPTRAFARAALGLPVETAGQALDAQAALMSSHHEMARAAVAETLIDKPLPDDVVRSVALSLNDTPASTLMARALAARPSLPADVLGAVAARIGNAKTSMRAFVSALARDELKTRRLVLGDVQALAKKLLDGDELEALAAADALGGTPVDELLAIALAKAAARRSGVARKTILRRLLGSKAFFPAPLLAPALEDKDPANRVLAAALMASMGDWSQYDLALVLASAEPSVGAEAIAVLPPLPVRDNLLESLEDFTVWPNDAARRNFARILAATPSDRAAKYLIRMLADNEDSVGHLAEQGLKDRKLNSQHVWGLLDLFRDPVRFEGAVGRVLAKAELNERHFEKLVKIAVSAGERADRIEAFKALNGRPVPGESRSLLVRAARDESPERPYQLKALAAGVDDPLVLVAELHGQAVADRARSLGPSIKHMSLEGFADTAFADAGKLSALLDELQAARDEDPQAYEFMSDGWQTLSSVRVERVQVVRPAERQFAVAGLSLSLPYAVPGVEFARTTGRDAVIARVDKRRDSVMGLEQLRAGFEAFEGLIEANFRALDVLSKSTEKLEKPAARSLLVELGRMHAFYLAMTKDSGFAPIDKLIAELSAALDKAPDGASLPSDLAERFTRLQSFGGNTVHGMVNFLHQRALESLLNLTPYTSDGTHQLFVGGRSLPLLVLDEDPMWTNGRISHAVVAMLASVGFWPDNAIAVVRGKTLALHCPLGAHSAELHLTLGEPDEGGIIRLRYSEGGDDDGNQLRLRYLKAALTRAGMDVATKGGQYLSAVLDKDHGLTAAAELERAFAAVVGAVSHTSNLDYALEGVQDFKTKGEAWRVADALADDVLANGRLTIHVGNSSSGRGLHLNYERHLQDDGKRADLSRALNAELRRLGLPELPEGVPLGSRTVEEHFAKPVRRALAAGDLEPGEDGAPRKSGRSVLLELAMLVAQEPEARARDAAALLGLPAGEPLGWVGGLRAERLYFDGPDGVAVAEVLRDPSTGSPVFARAPQGLDGLKKAGAPLVEKPMVSREMIGGGLALLRAAPPSPAMAAAPGLAASPGKGFATGVLFLDLNRAPLDAPGVFLAPYTTPDHLEAMRRAAAVVTTGGGLLSHAGITTREMGIPSVILTQARWLGWGARTAAYVNEAATGGKDALRTAGVARQDVKLEPGMLVRVDGRTGQVTPLPDLLKPVAAWLAQAAKGKLSPAELAEKLAGAAPGSRAAFVAFALEEGAGSALFEGRRGLVLDALAGVPSLRPDIAAFALRRVEDAVARLPGGAASHEELAGLDAALAALEPLARAAGLKASALSPLRVRRERAARQARAIVEFWFKQVADSAALMMTHFQEKFSAAFDSWLDWAMRGRDPVMLKAAQLRRQRDEAAEGRKRALDAVLAGGDVVPLALAGDDLAHLLGGKSAKLGEIQRVVASEGAEVPGGAALTTRAYRDFLKAAGIEKIVDELAARLDARLSSSSMEDPATRLFVEQTSSEIRAVIRGAPLSDQEGLGKKLLDWLRSEGYKGPYAVRSSAVQEDRQEAAFAGAAESYLFVEEDELLGKLVEGWASFWLPRGVEYRWQQGVTSAELAPALAVQTMVDAEASGVLFSRDPVTGKDETVINGAWGLGEGVVSGLVDADQYRLTPGGKLSRAPVLGDKKVEFVRRPDGRGTQIKPVDARRRKQPALDAAMLRKLTRVGKALEAYFGYPVDVEFAVRGGRLYILQTRAITGSGGDRA